MSDLMIPGPDAEPEKSRKKQAGGADRDTRGADQQRQHDARATNGHIPTEKECLSAIARVAGLVAMGKLKPAAANTIRSSFRDILQHHKAKTREAEKNLADGDVLGILAKDPMMLSLLEPLLSQDQIEMIMNRAGGLLGRLDSVSARLEDLLGDGRLDGMMDDLGSGARDLRAMAATGREGLPTALAELEALSAELRGFLEETRGPLGEGLEKLSGTAGRLDSLLADLQEASVGLKSLGHQLETGQGTLGRLVQEEDLYLRLESTLDDLESLLADIKADPQRYLTFELF